MFLGEPRTGPETFAEPGGHEPFSFAQFNAGIQGQLDSARAEGEAMRRVVGAAERTQILVDNTYARQEAIEQAVDRRIAAVRKATGVTLENYARIPPTTSTMAGFVEDPAPDDRRGAFHDKLRELAEAFPDKIADIRPDVAIEDDARAAAKNAEGELETLLADPALSGFGGFAAQLAGGFVGTFRDPLQVSLMFAGGGPGTAKTVLGRIGQVALREGLYNAGAVALSQPAVQAWRDEAGLRSGVMPAVENVGLAFLFGATIGGGIRAGGELLRPQRAAIEKVIAGTAGEAETRAALDAVKVKLSEADDAALRQAGREPAGDPDDVTAQALRHAENPATEPPPDIVALYPERPAAQERIIDETLATARGATETIDGKPVTFERFDPRTLSTDAATFQYKGGGDAEGVTDRLRHVTQWDAIASGKGIVFERRDGALVVADGHQRLGLARRLLDEDPRAGIAIDGFRFRAADGWTPADVRALAAKKNMQEGSGDALDAARILRERPDLLDGKLPVSGPMMKSAIALSRLSDEAFGAALNGVIPPGHAAAIGAMVPDPTQHAAVVADLARFKPETEREARLLIGEILASGFTAARQVDLFGASDIQRSLMAERVRVLDKALAELSQNKKLFGTLSQKAETIEAANNQLDRFGNRVKENQAARLADVLTRLAQRTGPVSDALNRAAAAMSEGLKAGKASKQFLDDVEALLSGNDLQSLLAEPRLKPSQAVEPGTPESLAAAEVANRERYTLETIHKLPDEGIEVFNIKDSHGDLAAAASFKIVGNKAELENITVMPRGGEEGEVAVSDARNRLGPRAIRDLLRQFQVLHPEVTELTGYRVSGARFGGFEVDPDGAGVEMSIRLSQRSRAAAQNEISEAGGVAGQNSAAASPATAFADFVSGQRGVGLPDLHARAAALQAQIGEAGAAIAGAPGGVRFINPGAKALESAAAKIVRKGYADATQLTDMARASFEVATAADADAVAAALAARFEVLDEGWKQNALGYTDRKLLVRGADGTIGEIQIVPAAMQRARKEAGGHKLYRAERALPEGSPEKLALRDRQRAIYAAASRELGEDFAGILETSSAPNSVNAARHAASDITAPVSETSELSTAAQAAPLSSTAKASPDGVSTAGRQSQLTKVKGIEPNMEPGAAESKASTDMAEPSLFEALAVSDRDDGADVRFISRAAALEDADKSALHADLVKACKD